MIIIKNDSDIKGIKECCRIVAEVLSAMEEHIKEGVTTMQLQMAAENIIKKNGAKSAFHKYSVPGLPPYPGYICTSVNSCIVHGIPSSETVLREGDIIGIDVGVKKKGYYGDAARTYGVGNISKQAKDLMDVTKKSLTKGISNARAGMYVGDISQAIGDFVLQSGYYAADNLTGHGVGKYLHEEPMIPNKGMKGTGAILRERMTIAIEPMVNIGTNKVQENGWEFFTADNSLSAHFEHTLLITDDEPIILTKVE